MKIKEIKNLRNIHEINYSEFSEYRTDCSVPDDEVYAKVYHPVIISSNKKIYDYTETAEKYLKRPHITSKTAKSTFLDLASDTTIVYELSELTVEQVQEIIDRNNYLFTKITNKVKENELLDQINEV